MEELNPDGIAAPVQVDRELFRVPVVEHNRIHPWPREDYPEHEVRIALPGGSVASGEALGEPRQAVLIRSREGHKPSRVEVEPGQVGGLQVAHGAWAVHRHSLAPGREL